MFVILYAKCFCCSISTVCHGNVPPCSNMLTKLICWLSWLGLFVYCSCFFSFLGRGHVCYDHCKKLRRKWVQFVVFVCLLVFLLPAYYPDMSLINSVENEFNVPIALSAFRDNTALLCRQDLFKQKTRYCNCNRNKPLAYISVKHSRTRR